MTDLPSSLRIGSVTYTVAADADACGLAEVEGLSNSNQLRIIVRGDRPRDFTALTLLHEVLHQCVAQAEVDLDRIGDELQGLAAEEMLVNAASGNLLGVIRDNPALIKYLTA